MHTSVHIKKAIFKSKTPPTGTQKPAEIHDNLTQTHQVKKRKACCFYFAWNLIYQSKSTHMMERAKLQDLLSMDASNTELHLIIFSRYFRPNGLIQHQQQSHLH